MVYVGEMNSTPRKEIFDKEKCSFCHKEKKNGIFYKYGNDLSGGIIWSAGSYCNKKCYDASKEYLT